MVLAVKKARSSEGPKESVERRAIRAAQYSRMTITCYIAGLLPLLQSGPRLTLNTQGSAEPPPWAKCSNRFAVNPTDSWAKFLYAFRRRQIVSCLALRNWLWRTSPTSPLVHNRSRHRQGFLLRKGFRLRQSSTMARNREEASDFAQPGSPDSIIGQRLRRTSRRTRRRETSGFLTN